MAKAPSPDFEACAVLSCDCTLAGVELAEGSVVGGTADRIRQLIEGGMGVICAVAPDAVEAGD